MSMDILDILSVGYQSIFGYSDRLTHMPISNNIHPYSFITLCQFDGWSSVVTRRMGKAVITATVQINAMMYLVWCLLALGFNGHMIAMYRSTLIATNVYALTCEHERGTIKAGRWYELKKVKSRVNFNCLTDSTLNYNVFDKKKIQKLFFIVKVDFLV